MAIRVPTPSNPFGAEDVFVFSNQMEHVGGSGAGAEWAGEHARLHPGLGGGQGDPFRPRVFNGTGPTQIVDHYTARHAAKFPLRDGTGRVVVLGSQRPLNVPEKFDTVDIDTATAALEDLLEQLPPDQPVGQFYAGIPAEPHLDISTFEGQSTNDYFDSAARALAESIGAVTYDESGADTAIYVSNGGVGWYTVDPELHEKLEHLGREAVGDLLTDAWGGATSLRPLGNNDGVHVGEQVGQLEILRELGIADRLWSVVAAHRWGGRSPHRSSMERGQTVLLGNSYLNPRGLSLAAQRCAEKAVNTRPSGGRDALTGLPTGSPAITEGYQQRLDGDELAAVGVVVVRTPDATASIGEGTYDERVAAHESSLRRFGQRVEELALANDAHAYALGGWGANSYLVALPAATPEEVAQLEGRMIDLQATLRHETSPEYAEVAPDGPVLTTRTVAASSQASKAGVLLSEAIQTAWQDTEVIINPPPPEPKRRRGIPDLRRTAYVPPTPGADAVNQVLSPVSRALPPGGQRGR